MILTYAFFLVILMVTGMHMAWPLKYRGVPRGR